jgi:uncharacterized protein
MTFSFRAADLSEAELEDWGPLAPPLARPLGGAMATHGLELWSDGQGTSTGTWQCGVGDSRWDFTNGEFIHVLAGSMTCTHDDGTVTVLTAGDSMTFPPGWAGTWLVTETLRKVYTIFPAA